MQNSNIALNILQGLRNKPKKTAYVKPDLIDVDLVRGESWISQHVMQVNPGPEETIQIAQIGTFVEVKAILVQIRTEIPAFFSKKECKALT